MSEKYQEADSKCCICIPIMLGMQIMGVLSCIEAIFIAVSGVIMLAGSPVFGIIMIAFSLPALFVAL